MRGNQPSARNYFSINERVDQVRTMCPDDVVPLGADTVADLDDNVSQPSLHQMTMG